MRCILVDSSKFKDFFSTVPTAVFVLGLKTDTRVVGCTISSIVSLDVEREQKILFTLGKDSRFGAMISSDNIISVNLLSFNQIPEAIHFSNVSRDIASDSLFTWNTNQDSIYLEGCETFLNCKLNKKIETESNTIVILDVINIELSKETRPLIYMNRIFNPFF
jgi:flavin reductase (DIM6/NTAB) family NADH-FMN oxidoreductase RutF